MRQGRVTVNGAVAKIAEEKADPEAADICVNGERLIWRQYTWVMLNKPAGYLSATEDGRGKTVLDLLPPGAAKAGAIPGGAAGQGHGGAVAVDQRGRDWPMTCCPLKSMLIRNTICGWRAA